MVDLKFDNMYSKYGSYEKMVAGKYMVNETYTKVMQELSDGREIVVLSRENGMISLRSAVYDDKNEIYYFFV